MTKDKYVGNLVKIERDNFKAFAIVLKPDYSIDKHGILYECWVIQSNHLEYEKMAIFVKENALKNPFEKSWNIVSKQYAE
jgi:hypothetical protein